MGNVVPMPLRHRPSQAVQSVSLSALMVTLREGKTPEVVRREQIAQARLDSLMALDVPTLRHMWDNVGDNSFYGDWDCAEIHTALNLKGDGAYCAV